MNKHDFNMVTLRNSAASTPPCLFNVGWPPFYFTDVSNADQEEETAKDKHGTQVFLVRRRSEGEDRRTLSRSSRPMCQVWRAAKPQALSVANGCPTTPDVVADVGTTAVDAAVQQQWLSLFEADSDVAWTAGNSPPQYHGIRIGTSDLEAGGDQTIHVSGRRVARNNIKPKSLPTPSQDSQLARSLVRRDCGESKQSAGWALAKCALAGWQGCQKKQTGLPRPVARVAFQGGCEHAS